MIDITDKTRCCGCSACFNICPQSAVGMKYDSEGFLYPKIDNEKCIKCGLCLKVCPIINKLQSNLLADELMDDKLKTPNNGRSVNFAQEGDKITPDFHTDKSFRNDGNKVSEVYGAKNKNVDEQLKSSSGGIFSIFANYVLEQKGIVFGASFDSNWKVIHKYINKKEDLDSLRRSKYVQSDINITYKQAKNFLNENKIVLFTGTPCQVSGLKRYLQQDYENLITVDLICFQVGSPLVFKKSLADSIDDTKKIKRINFRDKTDGWDRSKMLITLQNDMFSSQIIKYRDGYMSGLFSRPACHKCFFKGNRTSDFTIGDFWGINKIMPEMYDKNGVSVLTLNTQKSKYILEQIKNNILYSKILLIDVIKNNPAFAISAKQHPKRKEFFDRYENENVNKLIIELLKK